jgi:SAM-dependent methyltransferase
MPVQDRMLRFVRPDAAAEVSAFLNSPLGRRFIEQGRLVRSVALDTRNDTLLEDYRRELGGGIVVEHDRIPFPSFPYEWPPEMLYAAAELTLGLAEDCLSEDGGFVLKDATPYNVLFRGPQPVFIDLLSFEPREPGDPTWRPCAQFVRTFLLPLALSRHYGIRLDQTLLARRDGLAPEDVYPLLKTRHRFTPPFLTLVSLPKWLGSTVEKEDRGIYRKRLLANPRKAAFILESMFRGLGRRLRNVRPRAGRASVWTTYMRPREGAKSYSSDQFAAKHAFVESVLGEHRPKRVLDIGCNTGHFSLLAAGAGASVVAVDRDPVVVGETWRSAKAQGADVLPLVVDVSRPTPGVGWHNQECASFLDRARGSFDAVLMLAVLHHLLVTERAPLASVLSLAAELTTDLLVIEFVGPADPMFRKLLRGRGDLYREITRDAFESGCRPLFDIVRSRQIEGADRWLYLLRKRPA